MSTVLYAAVVVMYKRTVDVGVGLAVVGSFVVGDVGNFVGFLVVGLFVVGFAVVGALVGVVGFIVVGFIVGFFVVGFIVGTLVGFIVGAVVIAANWTEVPTVIKIDAITRVIVVKTNNMLTFAILHLLVRALV